MDGTLINSKGKLPPDFDEVMALLFERGVIFVPASGRQYCSLVEAMPKYEDDFAFIAENGAYASYSGEELFSSPLSKSSIRELLTAAKEIPDAFPVLCGRSCAFVEERWLPYKDEIDKFIANNVFVDDLFETLEKEAIVKMAFGDCLNERAEETIYPALKKAAPSEMRVLLSSHYWVDTLNKSVNKGATMKAVMAKFNVRAEECAAFGDYLNDIDMLKGVGYGYAMANAHPDVKKECSLIAPSNDDNGVMKTIRRLIDEGLISPKKSKK